MDKFNKVKEKINKDGKELKDKIIEIFQKKIDEINKIYNEYISNNNKIILIIENMFKSYKILKENPLIIHNILNNCIFNEQNKAKILLNKYYSNVETYFNEIKNYFKNEYIITNSSIREGFDINSFSYDTHPVKCIVELDNNICASCLEKSPNIILHNLDKLTKDKILFKADSSNINWIIKSNKNNLITCGNDSSIKIWPKIDEQLLDKTININENNEKNKNSFSVKDKNISINLEPIFVYKSDIHEINKIEKMINLKENQFIAVSKKYIFLFKYIINENDVSVNLIKCLELNFLSDLIDFYVMQKNENEILIINTKFNLYFLNIPEFQIINKMDVNKMQKNSLIQINQNEIITHDGEFIYIIDINSNKYKLIFKNNNNNDFLLILLS